MILDFIYTIKAYLKSFNIFIKYQLYKYLLILLILLILFVFPVVIFDFFINLIINLIPFSSAQKYALTGINIAASISGFFLLLILSPVFSLVSEKTGKRLTGLEYHFSPTQLIKDIFRGIKITLRNFFYQYLSISIISSILYFLPENITLKIIGSILIFIITAFFYGFSILDYAMENLRMNYSESIKFIYKHPGYALGLGSIYYLTISINNWKWITNKLAHFSIYWSAFAEALIAFFGVIAASYILFKKQQSLNNN